MPARVVLSMTSIPARNGTLGPTLVSLHAQVPAPEIRLYLGPGCARVDTVCCVPVTDRGPITKLTAVLDDELPGETIVVTVDDDILYPLGWLARLIASAEAHPEAAVGLSGWNVAGFLANVPGPAYQFVKTPGRCDVLEGWAGVAYRKHFFDNDVLQPPAAFRLVDDVWISTYLHQRGIPRRVIDPPQRPRARNEQPGLHSRADFVQLNRIAVCLGFAP